MLPNLSKLSLSDDHKHVDTGTQISEGDLYVEKLQRDMYLNHLKSGNWKPNKDYQHNFNLLRGVDERVSLVYHSPSQGKGWGLWAKDQPIEPGTLISPVTGVYITEEQYNGLPDESKRKIKNYKFSVMNIIEPAELERIEKDQRSGNYDLSLDYNIKTTKLFLVPSFQTTVYKKQSTTDKEGDYKPIGRLSDGRSLLPSNLTPLLWDGYAKWDADPEQMGVNYGYGKLDIGFLVNRSETTKGAAANATVARFFVKCSDDPNNYRVVMALVATTWIEIGEEILIDYAYPDEGEDEKKTTKPMRAGGASSSMDTAGNKRKAERRAKGVGGGNKGGDRRSAKAQQEAQLRKVKKALEEQEGKEEKEREAEEQKRIDDEIKEEMAARKVEEARLDALPKEVNAKSINDYAVQVSCLREAGCNTLLQQYNDSTIGEDTRSRTCTYFWPTWKRGWDVPLATQCGPRVRAFKVGPTKCFSLMACIPEHYGLRIDLLDKVIMRGGEYTLTESGHIDYESLALPFYRSLYIKTYRWSSRKLFDDFIGGFFTDGRLVPMDKAARIPFDAFFSAGVLEVDDGLGDDDESVPLTHTRYLMQFYHALDNVHAMLRRSELVNWPEAIDFMMNRIRSSSFLKDIISPDYATTSYKDVYNKHFHVFFSNAGVWDDIVREWFRVRQPATQFQELALWADKCYTLFGSLDPSAYNPQSLPNDPGDPQMANHPNCYAPFEEEEEEEEEDSSEYDDDEIERRLAQKRPVVPVSVDEEEEEDEEDGTKRIRVASAAAARGAALVSE